MTKLANEYITLLNNRLQGMKEEEKLCNKVIKAFQDTWNTNTIYFDYEIEQCPLATYIDNNGHKTDVLITSMTFSDDNRIDTIVGQIYDTDEEVKEYVERFDQIDYLNMFSHINAQLKERFVPYRQDADEVDNIAVID